ncbi:MAC1 interacting protein 1 [Colletotrichum orchidophilum]|uniref:MAC1 interacting protein 1 n=1 Tax=Colletotrichum orchidophilum TaxID=1209926 RepID=A0A1G4BHQ5_9PEZI|nr:MAC1 interacting protein 1 [Colletotrichum orchidophilum]OHF00934.1 MAC1 interacting protein 1 [Colletotrichum orchidophilum]
MKRNIIRLFAGAILLASGAAAAENCASVAVTAIPSCAQSCFLEGASFVGCDSLDFSCQCGKEAALYAAIEPCVATGCPAASFQAVINGASSGAVGGSTVSGSFVSAISGSAIGSSPAIATATPSAAAGGSASASATQGGGGGDTWNPLPTSSPFSTSSPVNAAGRQSNSNFAMLVAVVGMAVSVAVAP